MTPATITHYKSTLAPIIDSAPPVEGQQAFAVRVTSAGHTHPGPVYAFDAEAAAFDVIEECFRRQSQQIAPVDGDRYAAVVLDASGTLHLCQIVLDYRPILRIVSTDPIGVTP